jgi:hypothetical protein
MLHTLDKKSLFWQMTALLGAAAGGMLVARYVNARQINSAERLADALLHTENLQDAARALPEESAQALALCAAYFVKVAYNASEGMNFAGRAEDPIGYQRTHHHPYTKGSATVLTETTENAQAFAYTLRLPEIVEVCGVRRVEAERLVGANPVRPIPETMQVTFGEYSAQMESDFSVGDYLVYGRVRLSGSVALKDSNGNVGRLHVAEDGTVSGTVTRDNKIVGRFDGKVESGVYYKVNALEGDSAKG